MTAVGVKEERTLVSFKIWDTEAEQTELYELTRYVVRGDEDGPHVVVNAGSHGDEFLAIDTAERLYEELEPAAVSGTVSIVPEANIFAAAAGTRETPVPRFELYEDEERNLNRCFSTVDPEDPESAGTITERLAYHILDLVVDADYCLDLHTATNPGYKIDQIRKKSDGSFPAETRQEMERLVTRSGLEYIIKTPADTIGEGILAGVAPRYGVPTVTVEIGGGAYAEEELEEYLSVVRRLLRTAGALEGEPDRTEQQVYRDLVKVSAPTAGRYMKTKRPGDTVERGDVIGRIENDAGTHDVAVSYDGLVESVHRQEWVNEGTKLGHVAIKQERGLFEAVVTGLVRLLDSVLGRAYTPSSRR